MLSVETKTASEVIQAYIDNVYAKFGGSHKILLDNEMEFKNQLFESRAQELGVQYKKYTAINELILDLCKINDVLF